MDKRHCLWRHYITFSLLGVSRIEISLAAELYLSEKFSLGKPLRCITKGFY